MAKVKMDPQDVLKQVINHSEYIVIGLLVLVLVVMVLLMGRSSKLELPPPGKIDTNMTLPKDAITDVERALNGLVPIEQSKYQKELLERNMFAPQGQTGNN